MKINPSGTIFEDMVQIYLAPCNYKHAKENIQTYFPNIELIIDNWCQDNVMYGMHSDKTVTTLIIKREDSDNSKNPL